MDILLVFKWNQHPCRHALTWNQHCNLSRPEITVLSLRVAWNGHFALFKWNQHLCYHSATWNQHFNISRPETKVFEVYTVRAMNGLLILNWNQHPCCHALCEINILTHLGLKLPFLSLHAGLNEQLAHFKVKSTSLPSRLNVKLRKVNIGL